MIALAWANSLPEGKLKDRALTTVIVSIADSDPREAAKMINALPASSQDDAAGSLAARWAAEYRYTTQVMRGAQAKDAFPEFLARKGISAS